MLGVFTRFLVVFLAAVIAYGLTLYFYRKTSISFWSYIAVWLMELPLFLLFITGTASSIGYDLFIHTLGVPVMAALLAIADILLIEIALVAALSPLKVFLPKEISILFGVERALKSLQKYHALPKPERVGTVFTVAAFGGIIDLVVLIAAGAFF